MDETKYRPFAVTILALIVLSFTAINAVRFGAALSFWSTLIQYAPWPGPLYIALTGILWTIIGLPIYWGVWLGKPWARFACAAAVAVYAAYYWVDRLLFQGNPLRSNRPFALSVTAFMILFSSLTLLGARSFFSHTRKS
jgi:hypothetical protein